MVAAQHISTSTRCARSAARLAWTPAVVGLPAASGVYSGPTDTRAIFYLQKPSIIDWLPGLVYAHHLILCQNCHGLLQRPVKKESSVTGVNVHVGVQRLDF